MSKWCDNRREFLAGRRPDIRSALTMVELLVALTLSVTLMAAMTSLLRSLQPALQYAERTSSPAWPGRLASQLRQDLSTASGLHQQGDTIWITGQLASLSRQRNTAGAIGYTCISVGPSCSALVRIDHDGFEIFALGPKRVQIERVDELGIPQPLPPSNGPVPNRIRVWVFGSNLNQPDVLRDIVLW
jgi:hypothetical protein